MYQKFVFFLDMTQSIFQYGDRNSEPCLKSIHERLKLKFVSKFSSPLRRVKSGGACGQTLVSRSVFLGNTPRRKKNLVHSKGYLRGFSLQFYLFHPTRKTLGL
jgi:hypothetical protein